MGAENLAPTGIRSPERLARSESLYRLRYPCPQKGTHFFVCKGGETAIVMLKTLGATVQNLRCPGARDLCTPGLELAVT